MFVLNFLTVFFSVFSIMQTLKLTLPPPGSHPLIGPDGLPIVPGYLRQHLPKKYLEAANSNNSFPYSFFPFNLGPFMPPMPFMSPHVLPPQPPPPPRPPPQPPRLPLPPISPQIPSSPYFNSLVPPPAPAKVPAGSPSQQPAVPLPPPPPIPNLALDSMMHNYMHSPHARFNDAVGRSIHDILFPTWFGNDKKRLGDSLNNLTNTIFCHTKSILGIPFAPCRTTKSNKESGGVNNDSSDDGGDADSDDDDDNSEDDATEAPEEDDKYPSLDDVIAAYYEMGDNFRREIGKINKTNNLQTVNKNSTGSEDLMQKNITLSVQYAHLGRDTRNAIKKAVNQLKQDGKSKNDNDTLVILDLEGQNYKVLFDNKSEVKSRKIPKRKRRYRKKLRRRRKRRRFRTTTPFSYTVLVTSVF